MLERIPKYALHAPCCKWRSLFHPPLITSKILIVPEGCGNCFWVLLTLSTGRCCPLTCDAQTALFPQVPCPGNKRLRLNSCCGSATANSAPVTKDGFRFPSKFLLSKLCSGEVNLRKFARCTCGRISWPGHFACIL